MHKPAISDIEPKERYQNMVESNKKNNFLLQNIAQLTQKGFCHDMLIYFFWFF